MEWRCLRALLACRLCRIGFSNTPVTSQVKRHDSAESGNQFSSVGQSGPFVDCT